MPIQMEKKMCTGCTACVSSCPQHCMKMEKDIDGFGYPVVTCLERCIECGCCERACPLSREKVGQIHVPAIYAAYSVEEEIRRESSSGGIFTECACWILQQKGVVYGAEYNENFQVQHCFVENKENLKKLRGAKYAESDLGEIFSDILERLKNGQKVLFSGTPCQVAGLKSFLGKEYDDLYCIDFVCHGVSSPMAWEEYVRYRSEQDNSGKMPQAINLRAKDTGWSKYQYSNIFEYKNGKKHSVLSADSLYMKLFVGDYISRLSCSNCQFKGYSRVSDITLGDFWGIWDIDLEMDDNRGTSVVFVQSPKGESLWSAIGGTIKYKEMLPEQASRQNPSILVSSKSNPNRNETLEKIREGHIAECESLFMQPQICMFDRIKGKIKRIFCTEK